MMTKQNNKKTNQKKCILNCLRILLIAVCFSVFMIISYELLDNYFSGKVAVSSDWDYDNKLTQVKSPMVVICAQDPFGKGTDLREMFTIEEYMQKSINVTKAVVKMVSINSNYTNGYLGSSENLELRDLITADGHCTLLKINRKLLASERVILHLDKGTPSRIYILNDEEDLYMHYIPFLMDQNKIDLPLQVWSTAIDIFIEESIDNVGDGCILDESYDKRKCMVANILLNPQMKTCDLPWDIQRETNGFGKCKPKEYVSKAIAMSQTTGSFMHRILNGYKFCPDKCRTTKVKSYPPPQLMADNSNIKFLYKSNTLLESHGFSDTANTTYVQLKYLPNAKIVTKSYLVGDMELLSNIGGGLGLTLGLSIFSIIDDIIKKLLRM